MNCKIKKILILGNGASGKTQLSSQINHDGAILHLDSIYWRNGSYNHHSKEYFLNEIDKVLSMDSWIIEGTPMPGFEKRADHADMIIFLDTPTIVCIYRLLKKRIKKHCKRNAIPCCSPAKLNRKTLLWLMHFNSNQKKIMMKYLTKRDYSNKLRIIKNKADLNNLIHQANLSERQSR